jgi:hypothetical protein
VHEIEVNIIEHQIFQGRVDAFLDTLMPWIVKLGGDPDLASWHTGIFDSEAYFMLIAICERPSMFQLEYTFILGVTHVSMWR